MAISSRTAFLRNSLLVAAHPDDEVLWFGSILRDVEEVILVFQDNWKFPMLGQSRLNAIREHPHPNIICLGIGEAVVNGCGNWKNPIPNGIGLALSSRAVFREYKRRAKKAMGGFTQDQRYRMSRDIFRAYQENYDRIRSELRPHLQPGMNVFTHNPWGEYGHEDHVQIYRVLEQLRKEIGFTLWIQNYFSNRTFPLASRYFANLCGPHIRMPVDKVYNESIANIYRHNNCWTWEDNWTWFDDEHLMKAPPELTERPTKRHMFPLNYIGRGHQDRLF